MKQSEKLKKNEKMRAQKSARDLLKTEEAAKVGGSPRSEAVNPHANADNEISLSACNWDCLYTYTAHTDCENLETGFALPYSGVPDEAHPNAKFLRLKEIVSDAMCLLLESDLPCKHDIRELSDLRRTASSKDVQTARANAHIELQRGALKAQEELERALRNSAQMLKVVLQEQGEWAMDIPLDAVRHCPNPSGQRHGEAGCLESSQREMDGHERRDDESVH